MEYLHRAIKLKNERHQKETIEQQSKREQNKIVAEKQKQQKEIEILKNEELLSIFKQFDNYDLGDSEGVIESGLVSTTDGLKLVCLKIKTITTKSPIQELGAVLFSVRYLSENNIYVLRKYMRRDQKSFSEVGKYNNIESLMESIAVEVSKL